MGHFLASHYARSQTKFLTGPAHWVYEYLFAKTDRDNIDDRELAAFRKPAKTDEGLDDQQLDRLLGGGDFTEICHGR